MINNIIEFFQGKRNYAKCVALYSEDDKWVVSTPFINNLFDYLLYLGIEAEILSAFDNRYRSFKLNRSSKNLSRIGGIAFYNEKPHINISFSIGNVNAPNMLHLEIDSSITIDYFKIISIFKDNFNPYYGYAFNGKPKSTQPLMYSSGLGEKFNKLSGIPKQKFEIYREWLKNNKKTKNGFLREIYNINIINSLHFIKQINKTQTLKELIESDPRMGKLEIVYENCFMWTIRENDIEFVRQKIGIDNSIFIH